MKTPLSYDSTHPRHVILAIIACIASALSPLLADNARYVVAEAPIEVNGGAPWYVELSRDYLRTDAGKVALLFWRNPEDVPESFNLLDLLDPPRRVTHKESAEKTGCETKFFPSQNPLGFLIKNV